MSRLALYTLIALFWGSTVVAQALTGLARVDASRSEVVDDSGDVSLTLGLSQPVPYRLFTLDEPRRLVLDFSVVGTFRPQWSRMVMILDTPLAVTSSELRTQGEVELRLTLQEVTPETFAAEAGVPESLAFSIPTAEDLVAPRTRPNGERPVMVVLDPGHGGLDPGAERGGIIESDLMLMFARELREVLLRSGGFEVMLTRDDDIFVPLEMRQSIARAAGADVFISLHADALLEGRASGATIYTLSPEASDIASEKLAERHDRADLLAGVDLSQQDDSVARVLMDLARTDTNPRTDRLADALVVGMQNNIGNMHKRPRLQAAFSVLKSPDIPSVLIELGFMSSSQDLANLQSPEWRARAAAGIRDALRSWATSDALEGELIRQ